MKRGNHREFMCVCVCVCVCVCLCVFESTFLGLVHEFIVLFSVFYKREKCCHVCADWILDQNHVLVHISVVHFLSNKM